MNLVSYNLREYIDFDKVDDVVVRVNTAWHGPVDKLRKDLDKMDNYIIFLDYDRGRKKPPGSGITIEQLKEVILDYPNIWYFGISNVETMSDLAPFLNMPGIPVPKIETAQGIKSFVNSYDPLYHDHIPYVMIDHTDLFQDLVNNNLTSPLYEFWINPFIEKCSEKGIKCLRERGLLFSER